MISEKNILQTDFERKKHAKKFLGKIISCAEKKYYSWRVRLKKNLTPLYLWEKTPEVGEKIITSTKSPIPPSLAKKRICTLPSTKWPARVHHAVVFKTKVLHFKIENTPIEDKNGKRKFNGMLSFLFVDKRKLFAMKLSFEEFNLVSTWRIVALGLFWTNQGSDDSEETWGTFCTLWSSKVRF